jgi:hypothetical protein
MTELEYLKGLVGISTLLWLLFFAYVAIRIQLFIVKRYQQETNLLDTVYFREHADFTRIIPAFLASSLYIGHLLSIVWWWGFCSKKKPFSDISGKEDVLRHFTNKEIRRVKWFAYNSLIMVVHVTIYYSI